MLICSKMAQLMTKSDSPCISLTTRLPGETLFEILSYLNAASLARSVCVSKLFQIVSDEVQNQPFFISRNGDIRDVLPSLIECSPAAPTVAFIFRSESSCDETLSIHDSIGQLPPNCTILGCDDMLLLPPAHLIAPPARGANVTLAHFPNTHIHSFSFDEGDEINK